MVELKSEPKRLGFQSTVFPNTTTAFQLHLEVPHWSQGGPQRPLLPYIKLPSQNCVDYKCTYILTYVISLKIHFIKKKKIHPLGIV